MPKLYKKFLFTSPLSSDAVRRIITENTAPIEEFIIISKLSAAGVVVRTLQAPDTTQKFFGQLEPKIKIAQVRYTQNITPYQPILRLEVEENNHETQIRVHCQKHPEMFELGVLYNIAGIFLLFATMQIMSIRPDMALLAGIFGVALLIYPSLRAKVSFNEATKSAIEDLNSLPLNMTSQNATTL